MWHRPPMFVFPTHTGSKKIFIKSSILMAFCIFFSAAWTAQNSPNLIISFIDSFIYQMISCTISQSHRKEYENEKLTTYTLFTDGALVKEDP